MKNIITILVSINLISAPAYAGKKKKVIGKVGPMSHAIAASAAAHLKRVETVGGFLVWAEKHIPKKEVVEVRKWLAKKGIEETSYFPAYQVNKNVISYKRDRLEFHDDHFVINGKKYGFTNMSYVSFLDKVCKDLKCDQKKTSALEEALIPRADALAIFGVALWKVGLFVLGGWLARGWWDKRRRRNNSPGRRGTHCNDKALVCTGSIFGWEDMTNRPEGETYECKTDKDGNGEQLTLVAERSSGRLIQIFDARGDDVPIPSGFTRNFRNCAEARKHFNEYAAHNNRNSPTLRPGFEYVPGTSGAGGKLPDNSRQPSGKK